MAAITADEVISARNLSNALDAKLCRRALEPPVSRRKYDQLRRLRKVAYRRYRRMLAAWQRRPNPRNVDPYYVTIHTATMASRSSQATARMPSLDELEGW